MNKLDNSMLVKEWVDKIPTWFFSIEKFVSR